jgi:hypothetical protein
VCWAGVMRAGIFTRWDGAAHHGDLGCYVQNSVSLPASENRRYLIKRGVMGVYVADEMYS